MTARNPGHLSGFGIPDNAAESMNLGMLLRGLVVVSITVWREAAGVWRESEGGGFDDRPGAVRVREQPVPLTVRHKLAVVGGMDLPQASIHDPQQSDGGRAVRPGKLVGAREAMGHLASNRVVVAGCSNVNRPVVPALPVPHETPGCQFPAKAEEVQPLRQLAMDSCKFILSLWHQNQFDGLVAPSVVLLALGGQNPQAMGWYLVVWSRPQLPGNIPLLQAWPQNQDPFNSSLPPPVWTDWFPNVVHPARFVRPFRWDLNH